MGAGGRGGEAFIHWDSNTPFDNAGAAHGAVAISDEHTGAHWDG